MPQRAVKPKTTNQPKILADSNGEFTTYACVTKEQLSQNSPDIPILSRALINSILQDCGLLLSSEAEGRGCYPLDDHILCKNCNAKRINALTTKLATEL